MYSVVLMAALTTAGEAPACHWRGGCCGCSGSYYSCSGGCYGGGCSGCWGGCSGCWGGGYSYGCHGCYGGCYGSCYGSCYGCYGGGYSNYSPYPSMGYPEPAPAGRPEMTLPPKKEGGAFLPRPSNTAHLTVELPVDAKLFVDDQPMKTQSAQRTFRTPELQRGQAYYYVLRAEVVRDGQVYKDTARVVVRAGDEARASFADLGKQATAQAVLRTDR